MKMYDQFVNKALRQRRGSGAQFERDSSVPSQPSLDRGSAAPRRSSVDHQEEKIAIKVDTVFPELPEATSLEKKHHSPITTKV